MKKKILFFIGSLNSGGKERRLLELLTFLSHKGQYDLVLVTKKSEILFENFFELNVKWISLNSNNFKLSSFWDFKKIIRKEKPQIIHTWGNKQTFISLFALLFLKKIKLVNSQITSAPPKIALGERLIANLNFMFSDVILSNSFAGIEAYNPPHHKSKVIYNGLNMERFINLPNTEAIKKKYGMEKKFTIVMVASYSINKDYKRFFEVGLALNKLRDDTVFIGVGYYGAKSKHLYQRIVELTNKSPNLKTVPGCSEVEALVNATDMGILFSNSKVHGEGISNALIEYMALGKPIIANDAGGTKEIIQNDYNGYLIRDESPEEIAQMINILLDNPQKMMDMGNRSRDRIEKEFSLKRMGEDFENVYKSLI